MKIRQLAQTSACRSLTNTRQEKGFSVTPCSVLHHARCRGNRRSLLACKAQKEESGHDLVAVRITTQHNVKYGEVIKVVGAGVALGDWNPEAGPGMTWSDGDNWSVEVQVPVGSYDFKCVVMREDGSIAEWEPGDNRTLEVPTPDNSTQSVMEVICPWSDTSATFMSFDEQDDVLARLEASRQQEAQKVAQPLGDGANPASEPPREESEGLAKLDAGIVKDTKPIEEKIEAVADALEGGSKGQAAIATQSEEQTGTEAGDGLAKMDAGVFKGDDKPVEEKVEEVASAMGEGGKHREPSLKASVTGSTSSSFSDSAQGQNDSLATATSTVPALQGEPTKAVQTTATIVGLVAISIVGWSEFTLKTTGCGLPPGPSGLLGAAEGISYVVVLGVAAWAFVKKVISGKGLPPGPGGLLGAVEGLSYAVIIAGIAVLGLQLKDYGYIPAALPDSNCFGSSTSPPKKSRPVKQAGKSLDVGQSASTKDQGAYAMGSQDFKDLLSKVRESGTQRYSSVDGTSMTPISFPLERVLQVQPPEVADTNVQNPLALPFGQRFQTSMHRLETLVRSNTEAVAATLEEERSKGNEDNSVPQPLSSAVKGMQEFFSGPQTNMERLSSGVEDGLSSADLEPVVEELDSFITKLGNILSRLRDKAAQTPAEPNLQPSAASISQPEQRSPTAFVRSLAPKSSTTTDMSDFELPAPSQMPLRWVGMDLGISVAATNAATAANIVTQDLNSAILQLQSAVDGVKGVMQEVSQAETQQGIDLSRLSSAITDLEGTLERTKEVTPLKASLEPLADQLQAAAEAIRSSEGGSADTADRFEKAAASIREAAASFDVSAIDQATTAVSKTVEALPRSNEEAVEQPEEVVKPVISSVGKVKDLLEAAVKSLGATEQPQDANKPEEVENGVSVLPGSNASESANAASPIAEELTIAKEAAAPGVVTQVPTSSSVGLE